MKRTIQITHCALAALGLTLLVACGGSSSSGGGTTGATRLAYTDPTTGDYKLVRDAKDSTATHLILNLVGPPSTLLSGTGFYLNADASKVKWSVLNGGKHVSSAFFATPRIVESKVDKGELQAGVYQKGDLTGSVTETDPAKPSILATVALDLQSGQPAGDITLSAPAGKAVVLNAPGQSTTKPPSPTRPITIEVGALSAN